MVEFGEVREEVRTKLLGDGLAGCLADTVAEELQFLGEGYHLLELLVLDLEADVLHVDLEGGGGGCEGLLLELQQLRLEIDEHNIGTQLLILIDHGL